MSGHGLSQYCWDIAFGIYVQANTRAVPALAYCSKNGATNLTVCREVLERRFLAESVEYINSIVDMKGIWLQHGALIQTFLVEYRLHEWIDAMNTDTGVAPSYQDVFDKYRELREDMKMPPVNYAAYRDRRKWVSRFMTKWSATRRALVTHEAENAEIVTRKAIRGTQNTRQTHIFLVPFWGSDSGPEIRDPVTN